MEISDIAFPVYKLGQHKPFEMDGIVFYINKYEKDGKEVTTIIDDKNVLGESLAKRRLSLLKQKVPLFKLRVSIYFLSDLIKLAKSSKQWFIDSRGRPFQYKKNRFVNLTFKKIKEVYPITTGGSIIVVDSIEQRFKTMYKVTPDYKYAGLLELNSKSYLLYGIYLEKPNDTKRKI
mgnify:CR=1 FL=1|jgi:hypothetical protein